MKLVKKIIIFCIQLISKIFRWNNLRACRFTPSCSEYAVEAFRRMRLTRAFDLTVRRILRCHPFCEGGYDPLPMAQSENPRTG
ncbi:MAG: membrane protein insertion efficiency factor YidD [Candidatus Omnitrophica bacterium CG07_land_8_20_14_0_80_50_8]|nr:MAG: membrane protein insertion efficiency factor YidD [Candidatus Omnitrophica bacterium CG07_land_8_20_14_0_80_50_8]